MKHRLKLALFLLSKMLGLFALCRWATRYHLRILCYHGGNRGDERLFNPKLFCTQEQVVDRLSWLLKTGFAPISLDEAVAGIKRKTTSKRLPLVITVDDGWFSSRDDIIAPALERGFPVTLYVATEVLQNATPVLDVTINYILWKTRAASVDLQNLSSFVDGNYNLTKVAERELLASRALCWLRHVAHVPGAAARSLNQFATQMGLSEAELALDSRRFGYLTPTELAEISSAGCSIELHGHNHQYPLGRPELLHADIAKCRDILTAAGLPDPRHYCFPSGEYDEHATEVFESLGVASGTTCSPGMVDSRVPVSTVYLPRYLDGGNVSRLEFEAMLSGFDYFLRRALRPH